MNVAEQISAMNEEDFRELVDRDLRREDTQEEAEALRSPALVTRWYTVLVAMSKSVDGQLSAKRQDHDASQARMRKEFVKAEEELADAKSAQDKAAIETARKRQRKLREEWYVAAERYARARAATLRFKSGLDETLVEARLYRDRVTNKLYEAVVTQERNHYASRMRGLEDAIRDHAHQKIEDADLWAMVE